MLASFNALGRFPSTQSLKKQTRLFQNRDINHLEHSKQTTKKKRIFTEIDNDNDYPQKCKRALTDKEPQIVIENPTIIRLKQIEMNKLLAITTGMHPDLKETKEKITELSIMLRKVEQKSTVWKRKTLDLQKELLSSKNTASNLSKQVVQLEVERVVLQKRISVAEELSNTISVAMKNLISESNELKETISLMDKELTALTEDNAKFTEDDTRTDIEAADDMKECIELERALEDTMADLSDRLSEIEDLKKLLAKVAIEKNRLEKHVMKKQIIAEIVNIDDKEAEDKNVKKKIGKLQDALEKCMIRIAALTRNNEELKKLNCDISFSTDQDARLMDLLEDEEKLKVLEAVCMKRYRKLLKEAAEKMFSQQSVDNSSFIC